MNQVRYANVNLLRVAHSFPAAPRIMMEIGRLLRDPNAELGQIARHLRQDATLAARLLRIANSVVFAPGEPVASIDGAAALIGLQEVHRLVGAVAIDHFSLRNFPLYGFTGPRLRGNAVLVALLMEELARLTREDPPTAYSAGLFRSIGKLALSMIADEHGRLEPFRPTELLTLAGWEKRNFERTGNDATAAILTEWHFPQEVTQAIAEHYYPAASSHRLAHLLNLAGRGADELGHGLPGESAYWLDAAEFARSQGIDPKELKRATERAVTAFERINQALN